MSCTNCYNGCSEIVSDQCVKYTGIDVPALGISNGDTLATVEQAIVDFLVPTLNGTGITPAISPSVICDLVKSFLPTCTTCTGFTLNQILTAIIQSVCSLQTQINAVNTTLATLNADYTIGTCLTGVTSSSDTHAVLQAVINTLCAVDDAVSNIVTDILPQYVLITDINDYIQNYINNAPGANLMCNKMVPYTPIPFYPTSAYLAGKFDSSGAGIGNWANIYLCNGNNPGVPDLRGWVPVGATTMGVNDFPNETRPGYNGNPTYTLGGTNGTNTVALTSANQLPPHNHSAVSVTQETPHRHKFSDDRNGPTDPLRANNDITPVVTTPAEAAISGEGSGNGKIYNTSASSTGLTVTTTVGVTGSGLPHNNYQPGKGLYYIIYIPA